MPEDTSPHGGEVFHPPPQRARIPDPPQQEHRAGGALADTVESPGAGDMAMRPPLPAHASRQPVDVEDEDADPVVESGPGLEDPGDNGTVSVTRQPGG
jgi:hypothetical protein